MQEVCNTIKNTYSRRCVEIAIIYLIRVRKSEAFYTFLQGCDALQFRPMLSVGHLNMPMQCGIRRIYPTRNLLIPLLSWPRFQVKFFNAASVPRRAVRPRLLLALAPTAGRRRARRNFGVSFGSIAALREQNK